MERASESERWGGNDERASEGERTRGGERASERRGGNERASERDGTSETERASDGEGTASEQASDRERKREITSRKTSTARRPPRNIHETTSTTRHDTTRRPRHVHDTTTLLTKNNVHDATTSTHTKTPTIQRQQHKTQTKPPPNIDETSTHTRNVHTHETSTTTTTTTTTTTGQRRGEDKMCPGQQQNNKDDVHGLQTMSTPTTARQNVRSCNGGTTSRTTTAWTISTAKRQHPRRQQGDDTHTEATGRRRPRRQK